MKLNIVNIEVLETKLYEIASRKQQVLVRVALFGDVELCHYGNLSMSFDNDELGTPFFSVIHEKQYATAIRFYGTDVVRLTNERGVHEIYLGVKQKLDIQ